MDRRAWQATVHGVSKSRMWLSDFTSNFFNIPFNLYAETPGFPGGSDSKESAFSASFNVYVMYFLTRLYASLSLFNLNAKYIMGNAGLDESQAGIKIVRRNINTLDIQMIPF